MYVQTSKWAKKEGISFFRSKSRNGQELESVDNDESLVEPKSSTGSGSLANKLLQTVANKQNNDRKNRKRRGGKKHKRKQRTYFSLLGNNAAGIKAKKESLEALIEVFKKPSCITLQETKLAKNTYYQIPNYQALIKP